MWVALRKPIDFSGTLEPLIVEKTEAPYEVIVEKSHASVTIRPELTESEWADIQQAGDEILQQITVAKPRGLLVDLTPLEYMGSSLVAMVVRFWKAIQPQQQQFVVVSNSEVVRQVLELSGLAKMWEIVETKEQGLKRLGVTAGGNRSKWWAVIVVAVVLVAAAIGIGLMQQ